MAKKITAAEKEEALRLWQAGKTAYQIAKQLNRDPLTIRRALGFVIASS